MVKCKHVWSYVGKMGRKVVYYCVKCGARKG